MKKVPFHTVPKVPLEIFSCTVSDSRGIISEGCRDRAISNPPGLTRLGNIVAPRKRSFSSMDTAVERVLVEVRISTSGGLSITGPMVTRVSTVFGGRLAGKRVSEGGKR